VPRKPKTITISHPHATYQIRIVGDTPTPLRDFYHLLLQMSWTGTFAVISGLFLLGNMLFALGYVLTGGIAHAEPGSFKDAFFFSVQTLGTIGYGAMYPETSAANALVVLESLVGLIVTALATGLVFAKFSRSRSRIVFSREAVISPMNGRPTLAFRMGNERGNQIVNTEIRVAVVRTEKTSEGATLYRTYDLKLIRDRAFSLSRSWTVLHTIDESSPLHGQTPEACAAQDMEIHVMVVGLDDVSLQSVHALHRYFSPQLIWGAKHDDILS